MSFVEGICGGLYVEMTKSLLKMSEEQQCTFDPDTYLQIEESNVRTRALREIVANLSMDV
jgi:hypothetical protein